MNDALLMRGFECFGDLLGDRECLIERDRPCAMRSASVGPSTSSITSARCRPIFEAVDRGDVGMVQRGKTSASRSTGPGVPCRARTLGEDLDRHVAIQPGIARAIDLAHPTHTDLGDDFIGPRRVPGVRAKAGAIIRSSGQRGRDSSCVRPSASQESGFYEPSKSWRPVPETTLLGTRRDKGEIVEIGSIRSRRK